MVNQMNIIEVFNAYIIVLSFLNKSTFSCQVNYINSLS